MARLRRSSAQLKSDKEKREAEYEKIAKEVEFRFNIQLIREFRPYVERKHRFDYALVCCKLAIEFQGGTRSSYGHGSGQTGINDMEKHNFYQTRGWKFLYVPTQDLKAKLFLALTDYFLYNACNHKLVKQGVEDFSTDIF